VKKGIIFIGLVLASLCVVYANGAEQTWIGEITDSACKFEHVPVAEGEPVLPSPECVKVCLRGGSKYVLLVDDKLFDIENQKHPDLEKLAGRKVKLTGELKGNSITVSKAEAEESFLLNSRSLF
jgi:hypothetical protein